MSVKQYKLGLVLIISYPFTSCQKPFDSFCVSFYVSELRDKYINYVYTITFNYKINSKISWKIVLFVCDFMPISTSLQSSHILGHCHGVIMHHPWIKPANLGLQIWCSPYWANRMDLMSFTKYHFKVVSNEILLFSSLSIYKCM